MPAAGDTVTCPTRLEDSEMDQLTAPNDAFRVSGAPFKPTTIVVGETLRMPRAGGELAGELAGADEELVAGAGELGLVLDARPVGDGCPL